MLAGKRKSKKEKYTSKTNFTKSRNKLGYKVTYHTNKRKKEIEKKCYNETRKRKKGKKKITTMRKEK